MEVLLAVASGVLYAAGIYLMLRRRLAQLIIGLGLAVERHQSADLHRGRSHAGAAARRPGRRSTAGATVRRSGPAGAGPHGDRDRVRPAGLLARAGPSCARHGRHRRCGRCGAGTMRALVLPILVPLSTAAILLLAPKRPILQRWIGADRVDPPARQRGGRVPTGGRGRHPGAAGQRLAGAVRHHAGRRSALGHARCCRRRRRRGHHRGGIRRRRSAARSVRLPPADPDPVDGCVRAPS